VIVSAAQRLPRLATAIAVAASAVVAVTLLTVAGPSIPNPITTHAFAFYLLTAGAYAALPFVRRGDVLMAAMWMVLAAGVAPCAAGREISAPLMFADICGALMAGAPIYIARFRQVAQGDVRDLPRRRQTERETTLA
jgi:hypothetical protein